MKITDSVKYLGVFDNDIDLFEGQYTVPEGISYNSYAVIDEKIAVMDTVDKRFGDEWIRNIKEALSGRAPDYLVVHHMEPDHSASIRNFAEEFPEAKIVSSAKAFAMMKNFFGTDYKERQIVVGEGDSISLGERTLSFLTAPMVHWPEVIVSYDSRDKILFSADGFGRFGACDGDDWADEARRYYIGIVGKYGAQVQALLKKAAALDIAMICPLHGPVIKENLSYYISLYDKWSRYEPEEDGVVIAVASIYGNTLEAAKLLRDEIISLGYEKVVLYDLARCDMAKATADAFRYSKLVLASATYNADVFPFMREYIDHLTERGFKNRTVAFIENGSWAPMAAKTMRAMLEGAKDITYAEASVKILSALNDESKAAILALAKELVK